MTEVRSHAKTDIAVCLWILLFGEMLLFGLCLVDLLCSPSVHLSFQLLFLSKEAEKKKNDRQAAYTHWAFMKVIVKIAAPIGLRHR